MDNFTKLKELIKSKKNDMNSFITNSETDILNISDFAIDYKSFDKNPYTLNLFTYEKAIPEKKKDFANKLDYEMKNYYFLKLYINKDDDLLEITLNRSLTKKDIHLLFLDYLDKINFFNINDFLEYLLNAL